jgi:tetratricopeptide (TPR) repeat protein
MMKTNVLIVLTIIFGLSFDAATQARAAQDDARLDTLFGKLQVVTQAHDARIIELAIWEVWGQSGSATVDLLMQQAAQAMASRDDEHALNMLNTVVEQMPGFAEGWNKRATLYYMMGRMEESLADIERTLELEPRHFGALSGLGLVNSALGDDKAAYEAYQRALKVNPHLAHAKSEARRLRKKVKGEGI